jgi:integrase
MKIAMTDAAVQRLKPPPAGQVDVTDKGYPGLTLRISHGGRRTWCFFCRHGGRLRRIKLGLYPDLGLKEAREAWRQARGELQAGRDPARVRKPDGDSFIAGAEQWLKIDQAGKRTAPEAERIIRKYCAPLHAIRIESITRRDLRELIRGIATEGKVTMARRVHGRLQRLFNWALSEDLIEANPMEGLRKPGAEVRRERVLSDEEIAAVWRACDKLGWPFGPAIQLLILTGARRTEIGALRWSELDDDQVKLSGARTKTSTPHIISLSRGAREIIDSLPRIAESDFVFTTSGRTPISGWSNAKRQLEAIAQLGEHWIIHDLRRTVATGLQKLGTPLQVTEAVLGHVSGSRAGVVGIYQRHDYANEKRAALEAWGAHVTDLVEGREPGKVLPLRGAR